MTIPPWRALHGYLHGGGIEITANFENVLRGGLTAKPVDVAESLGILSFESGPPRVVTARRRVGPRSTTRDERLPDAHSAVPLRFPFPFRG